MSNETRNHKDNVFCILYREKKHLLSLYNAVNGTSYEDEDAMEVVTLEGAICMKMKNDAAFMIDARLNLYEHQATPNPNMPLRDLYYVVEELKEIAPPSGLHRTSKVKIPAPRFVVFYNGVEKQPERRIYRLSDLYDQKGENPELELIVTVMNINQGYNVELLEKCESLRGYMIFVEKVRNKKAAKLPLETAVSEAVEECITEGILTDFFREHKKEIVEMGIYEFDQEVYDRVLREDGEAIGFEKGKAVGYEEGKNHGIDQGRAREIVELGYELGIPESKILEKLQNKLNISKKKAQEYYKMFGLPTIRENGIPFELKLNVPNDVTAVAIEEGRRLAYDRDAKGYTDLKELKDDK